MNELQLTVNVILLFMVRIGLPMLVLVFSGILIDRWQSKRTPASKHSLVIH